MGARCPTITSPSLHHSYYILRKSTTFETPHHVTFSNIILSHSSVFSNIQLQVYADDVNLLGDNIDTIKKNTEKLIGSSKEVRLEVNAEKTKYMFLSRHQNAGPNHYIKIGNRCFENVEQFRYLGTTLTNQNLIHERI
jgi:hypothetical protein